MKRTAAMILAGLMLAQTGCLVIHDSAGSSYGSYGRVSRTQFSRIVSDNTRVRLGQTTEEALSIYPAENVSLMQSGVNAEGEPVSVYRVYARSHSTIFERYLVFQNDRLVLLTDDRGDLGSIDGLKD